MTSSKEGSQRLRDWEDAYTSLDHALSYFEQHGLRPDPYQHADLLHSLAAFSDGLYGISAIKAGDALIPARDRGPFSKPRGELALQLTVAELRSQLEQIRQDGVKSRPERAEQFGASTKAA
jgi:hypothetical protein